MSADYVQKCLLLVKQFSGRLFALRKPSGRTAVFVWLIAFIVFATFIWSTASSVEVPNLPATVIMLVAMLIPFHMSTQVLIAYEYRLMTRAIRSNCSLKEAINISIWGSIANLLPIPGSVAVRAVQLHKRQINPRKILLITVVVGMFSLCASLGLLVAIHLLGIRTTGLGICVVILGCGILRYWNAHSRWMFDLVVVQILLVTVDVLRVLVIGQQMNLRVDVADAAVSVTAAVVATLIGIFPSGVGLRESIVAIGGSRIGASSMLVSATVIDSFVRMIFLGVAAMVITGVHRINRNPEPAQTGEGLEPRNSAETAVAESQDSALLKAG